MLALDERRRLVSEDLYNELRWMLVAASEWQVCRGRPARDLARFPSHIQVVTMDSALLHARALYEFFIDSGQSRADTAAAARDFGFQCSETVLYNEYIKSLNKRLFHIDRSRPAPSGRHDAAVKTDLNTRIVDIASDVLRLWDAFTLASADLCNELSTARENAVADAAAAAKSMGALPVFT